MAENLAQRLDQVKDEETAYALFKLLSSIYTSLSSQSLGSAAITVSAAATVATGAAWVGMVGGKVQSGNNGLTGTPNATLVTVASGVAMPALVGTILQNNFGLWLFVINAAGTVSTLPLVQATTLAGIIFPAIPAGYTAIGGIIFNPTSATFIGGTTLTNAASTNGVALNIVGAFDPTATYSA
jgi:hypothetical protein